MVVRQRKAREARYDGADGTVGRMTGLPMPKNVPITDEGYEDFEAFFSGGDPSGSAAAGSSSSRSAAKSTKAAELMSKAARREARAKQDSNAFAPNFELGAVGRRTGIKIRNDVPRTQDGYEDFEAFFKSPNQASTSRSRMSARTSVASSVGVGRRASTVADADKSGWSMTNGHQDSENDEDNSDEDTRDHIVPVPMDDFEFEAGADNPISDDKPASDDEHSFANQAGTPASPQQTPPPDASSDYDEEEQDALHPLPTEQHQYSDDDEESVAHDVHFQDTNSESDNDEPNPFLDSRASAAANGKKSKRKGTDGATSPKKSANTKKRRWESEEPEGVRRSSRPHIQPLEYWRNERIVYNRRKSGVEPSWAIKEIVRKPPQEHRSLVSRSNKRGKRGGSRAKSETPAAQGATGEPIANPYEGWDDTTDPNGLTWDYVSQEERHRRVAFTSKMIHTKEAGKHAYRFQKVFTDGDYVACGLLEIPLNEKKPLKPSKDNTFMLFVHQGAVRVLVYRTTFTIAAGGFALVPRGNSYEIENIGMDVAKVVFMQAREVRVVETADGAAED